MHESTTTTIPFYLYTYTEDGGSTPSLANGGTLKFEGTSNGTAEEKAYHKITYAASASGGSFTEPINNLILKINSGDWGRALAGEYTATITFTAEVVVEQ